jgi:hypothetical protein
MALIIVVRAWVVNLDAARTTLRVDWRVESRHPSADVPWTGDGRVGRRRARTVELEQTALPAPPKRFRTGRIAGSTL